MFVVPFDRVRDTDRQTEREKDKQKERGKEMVRVKDKTEIVLKYYLILNWTLDLGILNIK